MAAVSKCSNLFLFYLTIKLKKTVLSKIQLLKICPVCLFAPHTTVAAYIIAGDNMCCKTQCAVDVDINCLVTKYASTHATRQTGGKS